MLFSDFNKLGDTSFRVKQQLVGMIDFLNFLNDFFASEEFDYSKISDEFKKWTEMKGIYYYNKTGNETSETKKINRAQIVFSQIASINVLPNSNINNITKNEIEDTIEKINKSPKAYFINSILKNKNKKNKNFAFKELVNYVLNSSKGELDSEHLVLCFMVWNGEESFAQLMEKTKEEIIDFISKKFLEQKKLKVKSNFYSNLKDASLFRKKINKQEIIYGILKDKNEGKKIQNADLELLLKNKSYLLDVINFQIKSEKIIDKSINSISTFINEISCEGLMIEILKIKHKKLLLKEYRDLNFRWMADLGLFSSRSTKHKKLNVKTFKKNFNFKNQYIEKINDEIAYPFTIEEISSFLLKIENLDFNFIFTANRSDWLQKVSRATLAEYFVNLYFAQLLKIPACEFNLFSKTIVDPISLLPYSTAPGGHADFEFFDKIQKRVVLVETTILSTLTSMKNNEIFPNIRHLDNVIKNNYDSYKDFYQIIVCMAKLDNNVKKDDSFKYSYCLNFNDKWNNNWIFKINNKPYLGIKNFYQIVEEKIF